MDNVGIVLTLVKFRHEVLDNVHRELHFSVSLKICRDLEDRGMKFGNYAMSCWLGKTNECA